MRIATLALSALILGGAPFTATYAQAQVTRAEELPGNRPIAAYSAPQRTYLRTYLRDRNVPSVQYGEPLAVGTQVPSSYTVYPIEGDPTLMGYRYARLNNRYIVLDTSGRVIDVIESDQ